MNKNIKTVITLSSLAILLCACRGGRGGSTISPSTSSSPSPTSTQSTTQIDPGDYYASIDSSLTGEALLNALNALNNSKRVRQVGYDEILDDPAHGVYVTDPGPSGNKYTVTSFYSGTERKGTSGMNREHVWPKSHGGNLVENDIHMIRPTITTENGSRGNSFYVEGKCDQSKGWDPAMEDFGDETYRGDSVRIIFYCCIADLRLTLIDEEYHATSNANPDYLMGKLSDLLKWNLRYSVLDREQIRNDGAESLQGNRNPFIDHPEYACKIWGSTNSTTRQICGM